jgi:hypothetical protein
MLALFIALGVCEAAGLTHVTLAFRGDEYVAVHDMIYHFPDECITILA